MELEPPTPTAQLPRIESIDLQSRVRGLPHIVLHRGLYWCGWRGERAYRGPSPKAAFACWQFFTRYAELQNNGIKTPR